MLKSSNKRVVLKVLKPGVEDVLATDMSFVYLVSRYVCVCVCVWCGRCTRHRHVIRVSSQQVRVCVCVCVCVCVVWKMYSQQTCHSCI